MKIKTEKGVGRITHMQYGRMKVVFDNDKSIQSIPLANTNLLNSKGIDVLESKNELMSELCFMLDSIGKYVIRTSQCILASALTLEEAKEKLIRAQIDACWKYRDKKIPKLYYTKVN